MKYIGLLAYSLFTFFILWVSCKSRPDNPEPIVLPDSFAVRELYLDSGEVFEKDISLYYRKVDTIPVYGGISIWGTAPVPDSLKIWRRSTDTVRPIGGLSFTGPSPEAQPILGTSWTPVPGTTYSIRMESSLATGTFYLLSVNPSPTGQAMYIGADSIIHVIDTAMAIKTLRKMRGMSDHDLYPEDNKFHLRVLLELIDFGWAKWPAEVTSGDLEEQRYYIWDSASNGYVRYWGKPKNAWTCLVAHHLEIGDTTFIAGCNYRDFQKDQDSVDIYVTNFWRLTKDMERIVYRPLTPGNGISIDSTDSGKWVITYDTLNISTGKMRLCGKGLIDSLLNEHEKKHADSSKPCRCFKIKE